MHGSHQSSIALFTSALGRRIAVATTTALAAASAAAQHPSLDLETIIGRPHLMQLPGGAIGGAHGYGVRFEQGSWELRTSGGAEGSPPCAVKYTLQSVGRSRNRGGLVAERVAAVIPAIDDRTVRYPRPGLVERYDMRPDGVEQSFVFHELPAGDGDLVVTGRLQTQLRASDSGVAVSDLSFTRPGGAGIAFGKVTGIDARGARAEGTMRFRDGQLDLILPEDFVKDAELPLVLDPLIGPTIALPIGALDGYDVAYDANTDRFLVAWSGADYYYFSQAFVLVQLVSPTGSFMGSVGIGGGYTYYSAAGAVRVAPAGDRPGFFVAYEITEELSCTEVRVNYVDAVSMSASNMVSVACDSLHDIGGTASGGAAVVIHGPQATRLEVDATGRLAIGSSLALPVTAGSGFGTASISPNGGAADRFLVVWDEKRGLEQNLFAAFLDSDLHVLDSGPIGLSSTSKSAPAVDGDGDKWCVAYQTAPPASIGCFGAFWDPGSASGYVTRDAVVASAGGAPCVAWTGGSYLITYVGGARSVDPFTCLGCEGDVTLPDPTQLHRVASQKSASPHAGDVVMIVTRRNATFFRADDGLLTDLGGGCGRGGRTSASCAVAGNREFAFRVRSALPFAPTALVLGAARLDLPCGLCTLVPDPASGIVLGAGSTNRFGDAAVSVPLLSSSLVGAQLMAQWLVGGGGSCLGSLDLSNALLVEIQ